MCAIAGLIRDESFTRYIDDQRVLDSVDHRGPDARGVRHLQNVSLYCTRLSIIDIQSGSNQPMYDSETGVCVAFNGEIYNFREIKKLWNLQCRRESDTEVILQAYLKTGLRFVSELRGMFAIAIHDPRSKSVHLIRDRFGIKPLLYSKQKDCLAFGSEVKAIEALGVDLRPNLNAIGRYIESGELCVGNETWFDGIISLEPGTILSLSTGSERKWCYWSPALAMSGDRERTPFEAQDEKVALDMLDSAMHEHLTSDVEVAISLSSGLDSTFLAHLLSRSTNATAQSFTYGFQDANYCEARKLKNLDIPNNINRHDLLIKPQGFIPKLENAVNVFETPLGGLGTFALTQLMKTVREAGIKVVLFGEGADEMFGGYRYYTEAYFRDLIGRGESVRLEAELKEFNCQNTKYPISLEDLRGRSIASLAPDGTNLGNANLWTGPELRPPVQQPNVHASGVKERILWDIQAVKLPKLLHFCDKATMASSVEGRLPFLDHRIYEWISRFDESALIQKGSSKWILKRLVQTLGGRVPEKGKQFVATPQREWIKKDLKSPILEYLDEGIVSSSKLVDYAGFRTTYLRYCDSKDLGNSFFVWKILNLEAWSRSFNMRL